MSDLNELLEEYSDSEGEIKAEGSLREIADIANRMLAKQAEIDKRTEELAIAKTELRKISEQELPEAMETAGVKEFTLEDDSKIVVGNEIYTSIKSGKQDEAFEWLEGNGHGSIIKNLISVQLERGQTAEAEILVTLIEGTGNKAKKKVSVHAGTLNKWGRGELEAGRFPPEELFNCFDLTVAKVKAPKK